MNVCNCNDGKIEKNLTHGVIFVVDYFSDYTNKECKHASTKSAIAKTIDMISYTSGHSYPTLGEH